MNSLGLKNFRLQCWSQRSIG